MSLESLTKALSTYTQAALKALATVAAVITLIGCQSPPINVSTQQISCSSGLAKEVLTVPCGKPKDILSGTTFGEGLRMKDSDDLELQKCSLKVQLLQEAMKKCDEAQRAATGATTRTQSISK